MKTISSIPRAAAACRHAPRPLVFVPTMGALHAGHLSLLAKARQLAGPRGTVAASIFVNPPQFGPKEDLSRYPRPLARDARLCREAGVDLLFTPRAQDIYPQDFSTWVDESRVSLPLCGQARPGHFRGVCTVVLKLLHIVAPHTAIFGQKDFQQLAVIRRMVRDLNLPVKIVAAPTVREPDGLALSSRNLYLTPAERAQAPVVYHALQKAARAPSSRPADLVRLIRREISTTHLARVDYIEALDAETLAPPAPATRRLVIACAVWFGKTRLIDNILRPMPPRSSSSR